MGQRWTVLAGIVVVLLLGLAIGYWLASRRAPATGGGGPPVVARPAPGIPAEALEVIKTKGFSPDNVTAALATYLPTGKHDDYLMFSSGGHSGQVLVVGIPSMRLLKVIAVFTPESWQGYGFGVKETAFTSALLDGRDPFNGVRVNGRIISWADTHHPNLSETNGDYDGQYLFIGDKASARLAVVDLRDFETKQIVKNPLGFSSHGAAFVTPNTEYVVETSQYGSPLGGAYAPISRYKEEYRGWMTFWKFDRKTGRIVPQESFAVEFPPYWQDLADCGKGPSDGFAFCNSLNTEMATGGIEKGNPPFEAGTAERDMDYLHIVNWKKAAQLVAAGKAKVVNGMKLLPLEVAAKEGVLFFAPEPKSPHGVDVCPCGEHIVVGGKLDPHVTVYSMKKILQAIEKKNFVGKDPYGVPILPFDAVKEAQIEIGLGPLHTVWDNQGYAYTSLFLDSAIARWTMGNCKYQAPEKPWTLIQKIPARYNVGHIASAEGDTVEPDGKWLVALNKWTIDNFVSVGPLLPQTFQLIDIAKSGERATVVYDMPIGVGEPHYAQIIKADKIKAWEIYPEVGWNPLTQSKHPKASTKGSITRKGKTVEVLMTQIRSHFEPEIIEVNKGDRVIIHLTNLERTRDATHGFALGAFNVNASVEPGETVTIEFVADRPGVFPFYCSEFCSALHLEMAGYLIVRP
ncbi:MAG: Sec-dependent nitrous-oxide reductase [Armatimonadetes bacterium]|nr:Sec-dependent nitrous-oxide reductase [Armatimonadota bacterium]MDW8121703.1 Sec-dependent nitrous-oxide reductase [Armatimonadota bacterium]